MERRVDDEGEVLRRLVEGTAGARGEEFFRSLARNLSLAVGSAYAVVAELAGSTPPRARTLALWGNAAFHEPREYDLAGTPGEQLTDGEPREYARDVRRAFPADPLLAALGVESYAGVALRDVTGAVVGHVAILHGRPLASDARRASILKIFAAHAATELERVRAERLLRASEERFRDLYEEAPIAYVYEDTESRFVSANRAAMRLLGLTPEEVPGTVGLTLVAQTPENQARVRAALEAVQRGEERAAIELELRRKDTGQPVWVQWWSKPDPEGKYTRTMLVDVTARVLAEQERNRLRQQNLYLQEEIKSEYNFEEIIGCSPALRRVLDGVRQVAPLDSTVLVLGETGTGKELIARALHNASPRRDKPLIKVNCSALAPSLVESELFGHEKGAFTGATERRVGRFALADGGTIFLDEVGDISPDVQVRLLRVLQEHEFEPVGSSKTVKVNVRVIAATNRDLEQAIADGTFRADLFYRLNVFPIHVPPLRARREDVPLLAHYFVEKYAAKIGKHVDRIAPETIARLVAYVWPGNIRELENVIERALILSSGPTLELEPHVLHASRAAAGADAAQDDGQRELILGTLQRCKWVIEGASGAARALGLNPNTLRSRMKKLGIRRTNDTVGG